MRVAEGREHFHMKPTLIDSTGGNQLSKKFIGQTPNNLGRVFHRSLRTLQAQPTLAVDWSRTCREQTCAAYAVSITLIL